MPRAVSRDRGNVAAPRAVCVLVRATHVLLAALGPLAFATSLARADEVSGTRSELLKEASHVVDLRIDHGHATLAVRRTVDNGGTRHDQALFRLFLLEGAVATGLRTLGSRDGKPVWFEAELMEAEAAAKKYEELTGIGGFYPKDPALLSWRGQGQLALQVFPVPPGEKKTIEYDLVMPTHYEEGHDRLVLSGMGTTALPAEVVVRAVHGGDTLFSDGVPLAQGAHVVLGPGRTIELSLARAAAPKLGGGLAVVPIASDKILVRPHVEIAAKLSELPAHADVVLVIDTSLSRSSADVAASITAARAYLASVPDASVEVLTFDREVTARHGKLVPAKTAAVDLGELSPKRRNGSHLDVALARAASAFDGRPRGARRVVVFTDLLTRAALTPGAVHAALGATGALVHVAVTTEGGAHVERDDESVWAKDVRRTGGLVWAARAPSESDDPSVRRAFEELARPLRIDRLHFTFDKLELKSALDLGIEAFPETMGEGESFAMLRFLRRPVGAVRVEGELWAQRVATTLAPSEDEAQRWSALVFGSPELFELSDEQMAPLARRAHAVTPVTSLLAIEPGVRPSTEGLEAGEGLGLSGVGHGGGGRGVGIGLGRIGFNGRPFLVGELERAWRACGGKGVASATIETTVREIVEVTVKTGDAARASCLRSAAWEIELPAGFRADHASFDVDVEG